MLHKPAPAWPVNLPSVMEKLDSGGAVVSGSLKSVFLVVVFQYSCVRITTVAT